MSSRFASRQEVALGLFSIANNCFNTSLSETPALNVGVFSLTFESKIYTVMSAKRRPLIFYPAILTTALLSVPLIGSIVSSEVNWSPSDYLIGGVLIFVVSTVELMLWRSMPKKSRWPVMGLLFLMFLVLWAEMAVGIFGSPLAGS